MKHTAYRSPSARLVDIQSYQQLTSRFHFSRVVIIVCISLFIIQYILIYYHFYTWIILVNKELIYESIDVFS